MAFNSWWQQVVNVIADGTAIASSTSQTSLLTGSPGASGGVWTAPANTFAPDTEILIRAAGKISTLVTSPGTLAFTVKIGSVNAMVSQTLALNTTAQTNQTWIYELHGTTRQAGSSTSTQIMWTAKFTSRAVVGSGAAGSAGVGMLLVPETSPAVSTGFDATAANAIDLQAQWSVNSASNSITLQQYSLAFKN